MSITNTIFNYNFGAVGGIFAAYNLLEIIFFNNIVYANSGQRGGILYTNDISPNTGISTIKLYQNEINSNSATEQGGLVWASHTKLNLTIE